MTTMTSSAELFSLLLAISLNHSNTAVEYKCNYIIPHSLKFFNCYQLFSDLKHRLTRTLMFLLPFQPYILLVFLTLTIWNHALSLNNYYVLTITTRH